MSNPNPTSGMPLPEAMAGNFQDAMRWFNQLWASGMDPGLAARNQAGSIPSMMLPTMDVKELEKRIADLRSVDHWLQVNQGMLRTTIQALEMQRNTLLAWQALGAAGAAAAASAPGASPGSAPASAPDAAAVPPAFQPALWWNALQQQFAQMASGAMAGETPPAAPSPAAPAAAERRPPGKAKSSGSTGT